MLDASHLPRQTYSHIAYPGQNTLTVGAARRFPAGEGNVKHFAFIKVVVDASNCSPQGQMSRLSISSQNWNYEHSGKLRL